jgi:hypothetical protein
MLFLTGPSRLGKSGMAAQNKSGKKSSRLKKAGREISTVVSDQKFACVVGFLCCI